jgi:hypothetical protein
MTDLTGHSAGELLEYMGMDAQRWAEEFTRVLSGKRIIHNAPAMENEREIDKDDVLAWFASALETGRSEGWATQSTGNPGINEIASRSNKTAHQKGWWDHSFDGRTFDGLLMLIVSEAAEALEEWRNNHEVTERYYTVTNYYPEVNDLISDDGPEATEDLRLWAKQFLRRGAGAVVKSVELPNPVAMKLVHAGFLKPEGIPSELADIIIRVGDVTEEYGIDLGEEVLLKMAYNATRQHRHGGKRS